MTLPCFMGKTYFPSVSSHLPWVTIRHFTIVYIVLLWKKLTSMVNGKYERFVKSFLERVFSRQKHLCTALIKKSSGDAWDSRHIEIFMPGPHQLLYLANPSLFSIDLFWWTGKGGPSASSSHINFPKHTISSQWQYDCTKLKRPIVYTLMPSTCVWEVVRKWGTRFAFENGL